MADPKAREQKLSHIQMQGMSAVSDKLTVSCHSHSVCEKGAANCKCFFKKDNIEEKAVGKNISALMHLVSHS